MIFFIKNKKKTCVISKSRYNIIEVKEYTRVITMYIFLWQDINETKYNLSQDG